MANLPTRYQNGDSPLNTRRASWRSRGLGVYKHQGQARGTPLFISQTKSPWCTSTIEASPRNIASGPSLRKPRQGNGFELELEIEIEIEQILSHMTQKPMPRVGKNVALPLSRHSRSNSLHSCVLRAPTGGPPPVDSPLPIPCRASGRHL